LGIRICYFLNDLELDGTTATKDDEEQIKDKDQNDDDETKSVVPKLTFLLLTFRDIEVSNHLVFNLDIR